MKNATSIDIPNHIVDRLRVQMNVANPERFTIELLQSYLDGLTVDARPSDGARSEFTAGATSEVRTGGRVTAPPPTLDPADDGGNAAPQPDGAGDFPEAAAAFDGTIASIAAYADYQGPGITLEQMHEVVANRFLRRGDSNA